MREFPNATKMPWELVVTPKPNSSEVWVELVADGGLIFGEIYYHGQSEHDDDPKANAALIVHAVNTLGEREKLLDEAQNALAECLEYFEDRYDVNWEGDGPNEEMSIGQEVAAILAKLEARDA